MALRTKLTSEQRKVLNAIHRGAQKAGASPKEIKAAIETGLVEANLTNPTGPPTDHDSQGWRQERQSLYPNPTNLEASVDRFFKETRAVRDKYGNAGDLAAAVQRPAAQYRGRYGERSAEAQQLLDSLTGGGGGSPVAAPVEGSDPTSAATEPTPVEPQPVPLEPLVPQVQPAQTQEFGLSARNSLALPENYVPPASTFAPPPVITTPEATATTDPTSASSPSSAVTQANPGATLVVGDSLGVGTAPYLEKQLGNVTADVKVGRPSSNGIQVLKNALGSGQKFGNVVLDLGTNDGGPQQLRASIREAKRLAGAGVNIYIPTVNGPAASAKNKVIREEAGGNVQVIDWGKAGVGADGIHATSRGYQRRARLIAQAIGGNTRQSLGRRTAGAGDLRPGGGYAGTEGIVEQLAREAHEFGLKTASGKRATVNTASGGVSDHYEGNKTADARDLSNGSQPTPEMDRTAKHFQRKFGFEDWKGVQNKNVTIGGKRFRIQMLYRTDVGGNHFNHVHIGVKAL